MEDPPAKPESSRLNQIRRILVGDRVEILERRVEILARNLGQEVDTARAEILRRFEPLEARLSDLETQFSALELKHAGQIVALRVDLQREFASALQSERGSSVEGQKRLEKRLEERLEEEVQGRIDGLEEQLGGAISTAVSAREELKSRLNSQLDAAQGKQQAQLEELNSRLNGQLEATQGKQQAQLEELKLLLGQQLNTLRHESTDRQELSALFEEFAQRLRGKPGISRE